MSLKLIDNMVPDALVAVEKVCQGALLSGAHKPDDWREQGIEGCLTHMFLHSDFVNIESGENLSKAADEDHLTNLCCRALMALQLRIEQTTRK